MPIKPFLLFLVGTLLLVVVCSLAWKALYKRATGERDDGPAIIAAVPPTAFVPPQEPIEMRASRQQVFENWQWVVGLLFLMAWLFGQDGWWRLLAWPAGLVVVLLVGAAALSAWSGSGTRISADRQELKVDDRIEVRRVPWRSVARTVIEERWSPASEHQTSRRYATRLLLFDARASELLSLDVPLHPEAAYADFIRSVPVWTGLPLETVRR